ncbi:hypothetical protein [Bradyrhizobium cosmicum]|uniref:hypothetical protein n=1 Tax=Bradyrhizobium cosmicum TaxID=1404864 RepID=UPI0028E39374|nr:hypothetical protein [Bradyrhizobium cosmicum]
MVDEYADTADVLGFAITAQLLPELGTRVGPGQPVEPERAQQVGIHENDAGMTASQVGRQMLSLECDVAIQLGLLAFLGCALFSAASGPALQQLRPAGAADELPLSNGQAAAGG